MNKVILLGNVGKDPVLRHTPGGSPVVQLSLATTETYKDKKSTTWHNIVCWGNLALSCSNYVRKGKQILVEGRLTHRSYEDKSGTTCYITEVIAENVQFLSGKQQETVPTTEEKEWYHPAKVDPKPISKEQLNKEMKKLSDYLEATGDTDPTPPNHELFPEDSIPF